MKQRAKTILVTGGAGYVGSHISLLLAQRGYTVIIVDNLSQGQQWSHSWASFLQGDCADTVFMQSVFQAYPIDTIIHCAASIEVSESLRQPLAYYLNNVAVTMNILQLMVHYQIPRIIFSSTCALYGQPQHLPMAEDHPLNPLSPYGQSKMMAEQVIKDSARAYGFSYALLRYFNAAGALPEYGLGEYHNPETHVIPRLIDAAYCAQPFTLYGTDYATPDGTCVRDYTHVLDIAQAHLLAFDYLDAGGESETFNLGAGKGTSVRQAMAAVEQVTSSKIKVITAPRRDGDAPILVADNRKAVSLLGWQPAFSDIQLIVQSAAVYMQAPYYKKREKRL